MDCKDYESCDVCECCKCCTYFLDFIILWFSLDLSPLYKISLAALAWFFREPRDQEVTTLMRLTATELSNVRELTQRKRWRNWNLNSLLCLQKNSIIDYSRDIYKDNSPSFVIKRNDGLICLSPFDIWLYVPL